MNANIEQYVKNQISRAPMALRGYTHDDRGNPYLQRHISVKLQNWAEDFLNGDKEIRIVLIPGLRGVGKTTALAQLYVKLYPNMPDRILYVSVDHVVNTLGGSLNDVLEAYQKLIGQSFESLERPLFLFIDEVHFDKKWQTVLKSVYDRSRNVFIFCTGSSALSMQSSADLARRAIFEKLYPMNFTEYILLKSRYRNALDSKIPVKFPVKGLKAKLNSALFSATSADECYKAVKALEDDIKSYLLDIDNLEIDNYLRFGSMPFAITIKNEERTHTLMQELIDKVIEKDFLEIGQFSTESIEVIKNLLLLIAASSQISFAKLANTLKNISVDTLTEILKALERSELLIRVYPFGSAYKKVRKPSRYHFMTPAIRHMLLTLIEGNSAFTGFKGFYLEDIVAMMLHRQFHQPLQSPLMYDSEKGGADFLLKTGKNTIAIEVGYGEKKKGQVLKSLQKCKGNYGIVLHNGAFELDDPVVKIPIQYFFLT